MANNSWTINSALERLKTELDCTVQFWLQHSHDKECGSVILLPYTIFTFNHVISTLQWVSTLPFTRG